MGNFTGGEAQNLVYCIVLCCSILSSHKERVNHIQYIQDYQKVDFYLRMWEPESTSETSHLVWPLMSPLKRMTQEG